MVEIKENQKLNVNNVLSYRGKIKHSEMGNIVKSMESRIQELGALRVGSPITATYGIEGDVIDVEILLPVDRYIDSTGDYVFKNRIQIVNAVVAIFKGHPVGLQEACNQLNQYIMEHGLQPITVGYNVTKNTDMLKPENTEIDVYVGISPNIL